MKRTVGISLKIPDNTAYTALVALRRLGIPVARVERCVIYSFDDGADEATLADRIRSDETIFNPNKHRLTILEDHLPGAGEVWIEPLEGKGPQAVAWRLFDADGAPVSDAFLDAAIERLLCNPAVDRAITRTAGDRTGHLFS